MINLYVKNKFIEGFCEQIFDLGISVNTVNMYTIFNSNKILVSPLKKTNKKPKINRNESFHGSLSYLFMISQYFPVFPLNGASSSTYQNTTFSWLSFKTIYSIWFATNTFILSFWCAFFEADSHEPFEISEMNDIFFYLGGALTSICFLLLARSWKSLMKKFEVIEKFLESYPRSKNLTTKTKILNSGLLIFAAAEHVTINGINLVKSFNCGRTLSVVFYRFFAQVTFNQFFTYVPYNIVLGLYLQIQNFFVAFAWTFTDLFLMNTSIHFTDKLIQLKNQISLTVQKQTQNPEAWTRLRKNYTDMLFLFETLNKKLNHIILLSFATNIYFLLTQLFAWLKTKNTSEVSTIQDIYHLFSLFLLISRTVFVCYYGAGIQEETTNIGNTLVMIPTYLYNDEVRKFIVEVKSSPMVLSGSRYFSISRRLILKITGAIVTYELVIIQFTKDLTFGVKREIC